MPAILKLPFWNESEGRLRGLWRLLLHFGFLIVIAILASNIGAEMFELVRGKALARDTGFLLSSLLLFASCTGSAFLVAKLIDRRRFSDFGLRLSKAWFIDLGFGFLLGTFLMCIIFAAELWMGWISVKETFVPSDQAIPFVVSLGFSFASFTLAAFAEEILYRGYYLKNLAEMLSCQFIKPRPAVILAVVISSILFSAGHLGNPSSSWVSTVNLVVGGLVLTLAYAATGRLALPFGFHVAWNLFQGNIFGFPVSGLRITPSLIKIQQQGDPLFTGGNFGPEAGISGLIALIIGALFILIWAHHRDGFRALLNIGELTRFNNNN